MKPANRPTLGAAQILQSPWLLGCLLIAVTVIAYLPARNAGFIWDDDDYVTNNPLLTTPDGLWRIWFSLDSPSQYFPMTYTVFRMEHAFWGLHPAGYHWVNILLHAVNALLVWRLLKALFIPGSWLAAAIFALHPVHVESVAWITELKNVLALFFFLLALIAWLKFIDQPAKRLWRFYWLALVLYFLALFSKSTVCVFPLVMLLALWLQKKSIGRIRLVQTVPFFALSLGMGLLTMWWERYHQGTHGSGFSMGFTDRILVASHAVWFYAGKLAWPAGLSFSYPRWTINSADPLAYGWLTAGLGLCGLVYFVRRFLGRGVEAGILFFVVCLSPLLGFIMLYTFRFSFVADHYQYLASIGLIALAAGGISTGFASLKKPYSWLKSAGCGLLLLTLGVLTWRQCETYADAETLWRSTIIKNPDSFLAYNNLGTVLFKEGRVEEATTNYQRALNINPNYAEAFNNVGNLALKKGRISEAITNYQRALNIDPDNATVHYNLGFALFQSGSTNEAMTEYQRAAALNPKDAELDYNLGCAFLQMGRGNEAIDYYNRALSVSPDYPAAHENIGNALLQEGRVDEAIAHFQEALEANPDNAAIHHNLGNIFLQRGNVNEAIAEYQKALATNPADAGTHYNLGTAFYMAGRMEEAIAQFQAGLAIKGDDVAAHYNLGLALLRTGRRTEAIAQFNEALRLKPDYEAAKAELRALGP